MNRRTFFSLSLAPLVVPWKAGQLSLMEQLDQIREALPVTPYDFQWQTVEAGRMSRMELQRRQNELHNQRIDNIVLNCTSDRFATFDLDDRSLWGKRLR